MSMILITHDLGIVRQNADRVAIMYAGGSSRRARRRDLRVARAPYTAPCSRRSPAGASAAGA